MASLRARSLSGLPEVRAGDDLAALIVAAIEDELRDGQVLAVAHKVVSKAENSVVALTEVTPTARARELAVEQRKDPRAVQVVLDQSDGGAARREWRADLPHAPRLRVRQRGRGRLQRRARRRP